MKSILTLLSTTGCLDIIPQLETYIASTLVETTSEEEENHVNFIKKDSGKYNVPVISSQVVDNKVFFEGNYLVLLSTVYADLFEITMEIDIDDSIDMDNGFSKNQYTIYFNKLQKIRSHKEYLFSDIKNFRSSSEGLQPEVEKIVAEFAHKNT